MQSQDDERKVRGALEKDEELLHKGESGERYRNKEISGDPNARLLHDMCELRHSEWL